MNSVHDKLTIIVSSILSTLFSHVKRYKTKHIKENEWIVKKLPRQQTSSSNSIPDFDVIEIVMLQKTKQCDVKQLKCSCQYTDVFGLPCVHAMVVTETFKPLWKEITHNDVSVQWWKKYYLFSLSHHML